MKSENLFAKSTYFFLLASSLAVFTACGPNSSQRQDNYKTDDATTAQQNTPEQENIATGDTATGTNLAEGQTGAGSGSGGLPGQSVGDRQFIAGEIVANYDEIKVAKQATRLSTNNEIKSIANTLEKEHMMAITQLKNLAKKKGIVVPPGDTTGVNADVKKVSNKTGTDFDRQWCETLIGLHTNTITRYEDVAKNSADEDLKNWINTVLPKLRMHQEMLAAAQGKLK